MNNKCTCKHTGNEPSPTGKGQCPHCFPTGAKVVGKDNGIWVVKTKSNGKNYWEKLPTTSLVHDGEVWRCSNCVKVDSTDDTAATVTITGKPKIKCVGGKCQVQPLEARYYIFSTDTPTDAINVFGATYGDIISRKGMYNCEETYIINKDGEPQQLDIDSEANCVVPGKILKDLGIHYWDHIQHDAGLGYPYSKAGFEELIQQGKKQKLHLEGLGKEYGTELVQVLTNNIGETSKKAVKKTSKKAVKKTSKKAVKKTSKKAVKKTSKKAVKKTSKKAVKKTSKKAVKKTSKKAVKKTSKKASKKSIPRKGCYEAMTKADLLERARKKKIPGRTGMTKTQLINALRKK